MCVCVQPVDITAVEHELEGLERFPLHITHATLRLWHQDFLLFQFHATASFVEAALGLINTQTIWQMLSTGSGTVPRSNEALNSAHNMGVGWGVIEMCSLQKEKKKGGGAQILAKSWKARYFKCTTSLPLFSLK